MHPLQASVPQAPGLDKRKTLAMKQLFSILLVLLLSAHAQAADIREGCKKTGLINPYKNYLSLRAAAPGQAFALEPAEPAVRQKAQDITYASTSGQRKTIDQYAQDNCITSILVAKDGKIVYESYFQGTRPDDRLYSASMAKTLTSIMIGILVDERRLALNQKVSDLLPDFRDSAFADDQVEDLLRMTSGTQLLDCYSDTDCKSGDNTRLNVQISPATNTSAYLKSKTEKSGAPGSRFFYSGANTALLGLLIQQYGAMAPQDLWESKVWKKIGAESDGYWIVNNGRELGYQCCYNATARDWLRIGIMLANKGAMGEARVLSPAYVEAMLSAHPAKAQPPAQGGRYGLHVWIPTLTPSKTLKTMEMRGSYGQYLVVDTESKVVILQTANARSERFFIADWPRVRHEIQNAFRH